MQGATIYIAAALLAVGGVATYATTPATYTADAIRLPGDAPYAGTTNSKRVLLYVSQAEHLIFNGDHSFAKMHLNEAMDVVQQLPANGEEDAGESIHRVVVLRILDGTREYQMMIAQPSNITNRLTISPDALAVGTHKITSAKVHYIASNWEKAALQSSLNKMLRAIETGKTSAVAAEFRHFHSLLLKGNERTVSDQRAAQDNVALARALLRIDAFNAAKSALTQADEHIKNMAAQDGASPKRFEEIAAIRNEIAEVTKAIERRQPGAFKTLDATLEKWWDALS